MTKQPSVETKIRNSLKDMFTPKMKIGIYHLAPISRLHELGMTDAVISDFAKYEGLPVGIKMVQKLINGGYASGRLCTEKEISVWMGGVPTFTPNNKEKK